MISLRTRSGFVLGPLAISWGKVSPGFMLVEPAQTVSGGLLFAGRAFRLTPWRKRLAPWGLQYDAGPALVLAWRL